MPIPTSFTFFAANGQFLNWTLTDTNTGAPINTATVTATLYVGRSRLNPDAVPGTADPNFTAINLVYIPTSAGQYQGLVTSAFDPTPGQGYVLVVDAVASGYQNQHWEVPAVVIPRNV